ncbi:uncharacterized protein SOCG_00173 [Schizosaccharomyces octosporus yFS286]|uniref:Uncharacterized protein n=1 Tax=Schizosaccharomyces octosporus (strain yFS286) TaxID=483514 RepID=S9REA6_SCHOY|nr:uncharacterized protein SOCG_00173 [Schizosaccharomyces octosporus yFS286]EPX72409.1 hypothetical protein SOCG_00173 [Schizosaccharomyces octosporus yFS286]
MSYKETVEETVPLSSEISLNPEENYNRCLWERLRKRNEGLSVFWEKFIRLNSIVMVYSYICYFAIKDKDTSVRGSFASYTIIPSSIFALICLLAIYAYFRPIVVDIDVDSIPMEELPRKDDGRE